MRRFSLVWRIAEKNRLGPAQLEELLRLVLADPARGPRAALRLSKRALAASVDPSGDGPDFPPVPPAITPKDGLLSESLVARHMVRSRAILDRLQTSTATITGAMASSGGAGTEALQLVVDRLDAAIEQGRAEAGEVECAAQHAPAQLAVALVGRPEAGCAELSRLAAATQLPVILHVEAWPEGSAHLSADTLAADLVCLAVGTDGSPPEELAPLASLVHQDKPVAVLLVHKENLQQARRRERFLAEPDRWCTAPDSVCQYFTDHLTRYCREQHMARPPLFPIHLSAALQADGESDAELADILRRGSHVDQFLAALRTWSIAERPIRRLINLLQRGTGAYCRQVDRLNGELQLMKKLRSDLHTKLRELSENVRTAHKLACTQFEQDMTQLEWNMQATVAAYAKAHHQYELRRLAGALTTLINEKGYSGQAINTILAYEGALRSAITGYIKDMAAQSALWVPPPSLPRDEAGLTVNTRLLSTVLKLMPIPIVNDLAVKLVDVITALIDDRQRKTDQAATWARNQVSGMVALWRKQGLDQLNQLREHVNRECTARLHLLSQHLGLLAQTVEDEKGRLEEEERLLCTALVQQL
ncbi:MAG: hypothetical protein ACM3XM_06765, partial [Mycobacterium leprae]